jgi:Protein of unknown function (DUF2839)
LTSIFAPDSIGTYNKTQIKVQVTRSTKPYKEERMGESKRRKEELGGSYGKDSQDYIFPGIPITKQQSEEFIDITSKCAWFGMVTMVIGWVVIRFIGPSFGWWELVG